MLVKWTPLETNDGLLLAMCEEAVYTLAVQGEQVLCGTKTGHLLVVKNGEPRKFEKHEYGIFAIKTLSNGNFITAGGDGKVVLWNPGYEILQEKQLSTKALRCAVHLDQGWAFGSSDSDIYITDSEFRVRQVLRGHRDSVFALEWNGIKLYSGGRDALLHSWDIESGRQELPVNAHWYHIHSIQKDPLGRWLATASLDKTIKLWDIHSGELLKVIDFDKFGLHKSSVNRILWLNENTLISASDDREIGVWEVNYE